MKHDRSRYNLLSSECVSTSNGTFEFEESGLALLVLILITLFPTQNKDCATYIACELIQFIVQVQRITQVLPHP